MILPHGGLLVNQVLAAEEKKVLCSRLGHYPKIVLDPKQLQDVRNIAWGVYSPLKGFLNEDDFNKVIKKMRLSHGPVWPIPIVLDISSQAYRRVKDQAPILLVARNQQPVAVLTDPSFYTYDKESLAENVYGTKDQNHPGVKSVYRMGEYLVGGEIKLLDESKGLFAELSFSPQETRKIFQDRGWQTVVGFQTRNIPHRGHEFLHQQALKVADGLFIQPVIGEKKLADFKDEYIIACYKELIKKYYPQDRVLLGVLPLRMRYAGPREAVYHALIRKNFGCTHFIVGRDHAGVGHYYGPYQAQEIFNQFGQEELGITILSYPEVVYDQKSRHYRFKDELGDNQGISFSGTKLREMVKKRQKPPAYLIRPEVYQILTNSDNTLVDPSYNLTRDNHQQGFVLWFTGLSASGKSATADRVYRILKKKGLKTERLDGDIVRRSLTKDLGFSKEDRDENIRRVRFVAKLLSQNGVAVVASFISPYKKQRQRLREETENFIEVFVNTPLEVCEQRDHKGLYARARRGEIKNFTGISDPYEEPENPEIELKPAEQTVEECAAQVIAYLEKEDLLN